MTYLWPTIGITCLLICIFEGVLWSFFIRNMRPMLFPRQLDASHLRFGTKGRLRSVALLHTLFLVLFSAILLIVIW